MKEVTKERTNIERYIVYQAIDGTEFTSKEECRKYEDSARGVLLHKLRDCIYTTEIDAWSLMGGMDDNKVVGFKLSKETKDTFTHFLLLECPWYLHEGQENRKEVVLKIVEDAVKSKDLILMGTNCDGDYYFINSRQNIIDNLMNFDRKEEEK